MAFVNKSHNQPVRLRGAAGTGKTQAMTIKCINDLLSDLAGENTKTFAFLTHSSALAHDVILGMFAAQILRTSARTVDGLPKLWVGTLYELAEERLNYAQKGLQPLSLTVRRGANISVSSSPTPLPRFWLIPESCWMCWPTRPTSPRRSPQTSAAQHSLTNS
jgi:hypothetical protein